MKKGQNVSKTGSKGGQTRGKVLELTRTHKTGFVLKPGQRTWVINETDRGGYVVHQYNGLKLYARLALSDANTLLVWLNDRLPLDELPPTG